MGIGAFIWRRAARLVVRSRSDDGRWYSEGRWHLQPKPIVNLLHVDSNGHLAA